MPGGCRASSWPRLASSVRGGPGGHDPNPGSALCRDPFKLRSSPGRRPGRPMGESAAGRSCGQVRKGGSPRGRGPGPGWPSGASESAGAGPSCHGDARRGLGGANLKAPRCTAEPPEATEPGAACRPASMRQHGNGSPGPGRVRAQPQACFRRRSHTVSVRAVNIHLASRKTAIGDSRLTAHRSKQPPRSLAPVDTVLVEKSDQP